MRWIICGIWLVVITNCTTGPDTIGIDDRFYRFNNDAYEKQIGEQGSYLKQIAHIQQAAKEEKQRLNSAENTSKYQKQTFLARLNNAEADVELLNKKNVTQLDVHIKQVMEAITRLKRQAMLQPKVLATHESQMDSINDLIKQMQDIVNNLK